MGRLTIVLADDHHVMREGLRTLLEREIACTIVGEAADGAAAVALVTELRPDILLLDLMMPGMGGLDVLRAVAARAPRTRTVVLSMHSDELYVREALRTGAAGYVLKEAQASELILAVHEAAAGRRYLSAALSERMIDAYIHQSGPVADPYDLLSERERTVLRLVALGHTSAEIAAQLSLSPRTVETYRTNLFHKLDLRHQTDLVRYALRRGIIPLD